MRSKSKKRSSTIDTSQKLGGQKITEHRVFALAIPPERLKTESDLRAELSQLESEHRKLKAVQNAIFIAIVNINNKFKDIISQIRIHERRFLESYFPHREKEFLEWLKKETEKSNEEIPVPTLSEKERRHLRSLYTKIARITHPDVDKNREYAHLFDEAAKAHRRGDVVTLEHILEELETHKPVYSSSFQTTIKELTERRNKLKTLIEHIRKNISELELFGIEAKKYISPDFRFNNEVFGKAVEILLHSRLESYGNLEKEGEVSPTPTKGISTGTSLVLSMPIMDLSIISEQEKEAMLRQRLERILKQLDRITPYYHGHVGGDITLRIASDESLFSEHLQIFVNKPVDFSREYGKNEMHLPLDESRVIELTASTRNGILFLSYPDGRIIIPKHVLQDKYANAMAALELAEKVLSKPLRVLTAFNPFKGNPIPILGDYAEHTHSGLSPEYKLDTISEVIVARLLRTMALVKIPRLIERKFVKNRYVWVEELDSSFSYDGKEEPGQTVKISINKGAHVVTGTVIEMEDRVYFVDPFTKLIRCHKVNWEGYLNINNQTVPFSMEFRSNNDSIVVLGDVIGDSIKDHHDGFELQLSINEKSINLSYRKSKSNDYHLMVDGIEEELLPELLFKIVETLQVAKVSGIFIDKLRERNLEYI